MDNILLLAVASAVAAKKKKRSAGGARNFMREGMSVQQRRNRGGKIRRKSLLPPDKSAFMHLFNSGQDDSLITLCGLDHASFNELHVLFQPFFHEYTPFTKDGLIHKLAEDEPRGRKRSITSTMCLGLVLAWTRTRGSLSVLSIIFGLTYSTVTVWLRFGRRMLILILKNNPKAKVRLPDANEMGELVESIRLKYPALPPCWGAMDGLKVCHTLRVASPALTLSLCKTTFTMDGNMITTSTVYSCSLLMGSLGCATSIALGRCMTQQWLSGVTVTKRLTICIMCTMPKLLLTLLLQKKNASRL